MKKEQINIRDPFVVYENEKYYLYTKEEKKWVKEEITFAEWNCFNGQYLASVFLEQIEEPKLQGTQKVNGKSAYKYNGVIKKEGLQKIILDAKCLELLAKGFQGGLLKTVGSLLTQEDKISSLTEKSEDLKVSVWIDKETGYPILCAMDVGEMLNDSFGRLTGRIGSEEDKSTSNKVSLWSGVMITEAKIMIQCGEFK